MACRAGRVTALATGVQGTGVNLEAENEGMLGSGQQAMNMQGLPPERLALNRNPLEDKVSRALYPAEGWLVAESRSGFQQAHRPLELPLPSQTFLFPL